MSTPRGAARSFASAPTPPSALVLCVRRVAIRMAEPPTAAAAGCAGEPQTCASMRVAAAERAQTRVCLRAPGRRGRMVPRKGRGEGGERGARGRRCAGGGSRDGGQGRRRGEGPCASDGCGAKGHIAAALHRDEALRAGRAPPTVRTSTRYARPRRCCMADAAPVLSSDVGIDRAAVGTVPIRHGSRKRWATRSVSPSHAAVAAAACCSRRSSRYSSASPSARPSQSAAGVVTVAARCDRQVGAATPVEGAHRHHRWSR